METLNSDLADLLMQQEDIRLQKMVSVESAQFCSVLSGQDYGSRVGETR
jgi:hypothetical protein